MACPNKNTPEWRLLEESLGVFSAYKLFIANGYEIPSLEEIEGFLDKVNPLIGSEYNQLSPSDIQNYQNQLENYESRTGNKPPKKMKEVIESLLLQQTEVSSKDDETYVHTATGTPLERATTYLENSDKEFYGFDGDETLYEDNRQWGNQIDFILSSITLGKNERDTLQDLKQFAISEGNDLMLSDKAFNTAYEALNNFVKSFPNSVVLSQIKFFNVEKGVAGTADIVVVDPDGSIRIFDLKSSVNPTNYDPDTKRFAPYNTGKFENQYDRRFKGGKKASRKDKHSGQLSIYKGLAMSQGYSFSDQNELGIIPMHITSTSENTVTELAPEPIFYLDAYRKFLDELHEVTEEDVDFSKFKQTDKLLDKIKQVLENRLLLLERNPKNSRAEKYITQQLKESIETVEKTKAISQFIDTIYAQLRGSKNFPGDLKMLEKTIRDAKEGNNADKAEMITRLVKAKETVDMLKPIVSQIQAFLDMEIGGKEALTPGTPLSKANSIVAAFSRIESIYNEEMNPQVAKLLSESISKKANIKHIEEITSLKKKLGRLDPDSRAYKLTKRRLETLEKEIGEDGVTYNTILKALEDGSNRDVPFLDFLLTPAISSSNPIVALFAKTLKAAYENARQISIRTAHKASKGFKKYATSTSENRNVPSSFYKPFYTRTKVYDHGKKELVDKMAFVQEVDMSAYNEALNNMYKQAESITDPTQKNAFIQSWYKENTEALPYEDRTVTNPETGEVVVIEKGRKTIIEEHKKLVEDNVISEKQFEFWLKNNQVEIQGVTYYSRDFSRPSRAKYADPRYKQIQSSKNKKEFYDLLIATYFKSQQRVPDRAKRGYILPSVAKSDIDRLVENGAINYAKYSWRNLVKYTEEDAFIYGEKVEGQKVIPVLYTQNMPAEDVSLDLLSSVLMFDQASLKFEAANESVVVGTAALESTKQNPPLKTDALGNRFISEAAKKAGITSWDKYVKKHGGNNIAALLEVFMDMQIYGVQQLESKTAIAGKVVDFNKLAANLMGFGSKTQIGGNPVGSAANSLQANAQLMIEAASDEFFNQKEVAWAKVYYARNIGNYVKDFTQPTATSFIGQLIELYDPMQGEYTDRYGRKVSMSAMKKAWSTDTWFFLQNQGEHAIQVQAMLAMLKRNKVKQKIGGITKEISLIDAYELGPDGAIRLKEGVSLEGTPTANGLVDMDIQNSLHAINKRMHGVYNNFDKVTAERHWLGRLALMYRKFFPSGMKKRFKTYGLDQELGAPTEGYYNTFFRLVTSQLKDTLVQLSPFSSSENLTPLERRNLSRAGAELAFISVTGIISMILARLSDEADDEDKKLLAYPLLFSLRLHQELFGFINPIANYKTFSNPMAAQTVIEKTIRLIKQLFNPLETYQRDTGVWEKGDYKIVAKFLKLLGSGRIETIMSPDELIKVMQNLRI